MAKTFLEHVKALNATRDDRIKKQREVAQAAMDEQRSMNEAEQAEFDELANEIKQLDADISRYSLLAAADKETAKAVDDKEGKETHNTIKSITVEPNEEKLEPGIAFARLARVKALAHLGLVNGLRDQSAIAKMLYPHDRRLQKAVVPAAATTDANWAGNLILDRGGFADFVEYLRPRTLYGQIAPTFRRLPFDTPVLIQSSAGSAAWVAEGQAKPVTNWGYTRAKLAPLKVASIAAATQETLRRASLSADALIRDELARAVGSAIDATLIGLTQGTAGESPDGLRYGVSPTLLVGDGSVQGIRCDISTMLKELIGNNLTLGGAYWVMSEATAVDLSMITNEVGATAFPGVTPNGGTLSGLPVYTSQYVPFETAGPVVMLVKGDEVFLGDEGGVEVAVSDQASLQMLDNPTNESVDSTVPTSLVSMWQTNSVAFRVERFLNWQKRRSAGVVWANVNWAACQS